MSAPPVITRAQGRWLLMGIWIAVSAALLAINWHFLVPLNFRDPDDALRLVQVRDLIAGQSWFDLTQHRINPPDGTLMHWSRLVDLPVAVPLMLLEPLLGQALAERATLIIVPLAQLGALFMLVHLLARRLGLARGAALLSALMLATSLSILVQFAPMRIDHHSAQILLGALAALALVSTGRKDGRMGLVAGLAMAAWLQISIEGLPSAVAMGGIFALRHMVRTDGWRDLRAYLLGLGGGCLLLLASTRAPIDALTPWCDALSTSYLAPLLAASAVTIIAARLVPNGTLAGRTAPLALGGLAGAALFLLTARQCLAGPFETLDPTVYHEWYQMVREGMPITSQKSDLQALILLPSLFGLLGSALGWHGARDNADRRLAWASLFLLQLVTVLVSINVMRAMSYAHVLALPGNALLLARLMSAAQRLRTMPVRVLLSAGTVALTPFGAAAGTAAALNPATNSATSSTIPDRFRCTTQATLRGLNALPPALIFTPLDIGAHLLVYTHHSVVGTGHHRNVKGMKAVIEGLIATPDEARRIIANTGARYVAFCDGENEITRYAEVHPGSLIALLLAGDRPDWLVPVPMRPGETIHVMMIAPAGPTGA